MISKSSSPNREPTFNIASTGLPPPRYNLFAIGIHENGDEFETGHPESHTPIAMAQTIRSANPLATLSTYENRMHHRLMQTLRQLRDIQVERRAEEARDLEAMKEIALNFPKAAEKMEPNKLGFVCSTGQRLNHWRRLSLAKPDIARIDLCEDRKAMNQNCRAIFQKTQFLTAS